jgi:Cytotoxic
MGLPSGENPMKRATGRFVDGLQRVKSKTHRRRWHGRKRQIYEEDTQHGDLEKYNGDGMHKGSVDPDTGEIIKMPVKGRITPM